MGGMCVPRVEEDSAGCFATPDTIEEMGTEIKRARKFDVQVLSEDFLAKVQDRHSKGKSVGVPALIQKMNVADWGSDPNERIGDIPDEFDNGVHKSAAEKLYCKSGSGRWGVGFWWENGNREKQGIDQQFSTFPVSSR